MQREGNLTERPFFRVIQDILQVKATGTLIAQSLQSTVYVTFELGLCVNVEVTGGREDVLIGQLMVNRGLATQDDIASLLDTQKLSLAKLGFLARQAGIVTTLQLMEILEDQMLIHLAPCFTWTKGLFYFRFEDSILYDKDSSRPLDLSDIADFGETILKEWPWITKRFADTNQIPQLVAGIQVLPPGVQMDSFKGQGIPPVLLTIESEKLYHLIDGSHSIRSILDRCHQFEFFSFKALVDLEDSGVIRIPEIVVQPAERKSFDWSRLPVLLSGQSRMMMVPLATLAMVLILWFVPISLLPSVSIHAPPLEKTILTKMKAQRLQHGLVAFYLINRRFPDFVSELIDGGYLLERDLKDAWDSNLLYKKNKGGYTIASQGEDRIWATEDDFKIEEKEFQIESGSFFPK